MQQVTLCVFVYLLWLTCVCLLVDVLAMCLGQTGHACALLHADPTCCRDMQGNIAG